MLCRKLRTIHISKALVAKVCRRDLWTAEQIRDSFISSLLFLSSSQIRAPRASQRQTAKKATSAPTATVGVMLSTLRFSPSLGSLFRYEVTIFPAENLRSCCCLTRLWNVKQNRSCCFEFQKCWPGKHLCGEARLMTHPGVKREAFPFSLHACCLERVPASIQLHRIPSVSFQAFKQESAECTTLQIPPSRLARSLLGVRWRMMRTYPGEHLRDGGRREEEEEERCGRQLFLETASCWVTFQESMPAPCLLCLKSQSWLVFVSHSGSGRKMKWRANEELSK